MQTQTTVTRCCRHHTCRSHRSILPRDGRGIHRRTAFTTSARTLSPINPFHHSLSSTHISYALSLSLSFYAFTPAPPWRKRRWPFGRRQRIRRTPPCQEHTVSIAQNPTTVPTHAHCTHTHS